MLPIEELLEEVEKDSVIDRNKIEAEILNCASLQAKWLKLHYKYKYACIKGETLLAELVVKAQLFYSGQAEPNTYRSHPHREIRSKNGTEMGRLIDGDFDANGMREKVDIANEGKEICERMLEAIKFRPNHLKTILEYRKFQSGE